MKRKIWIIATLAMLSVILVPFLMRNADPITYELSPLDETTTIRVNKVVSRIASYNYDVVLYRVGDRVCEFNGDATIVYTDEQPEFVFVDSPWAYSDIGTFYVPLDGVKYGNGVGLR